MNASWQYLFFLRVMTPLGIALGLGLTHATAADTSTTPKAIQAAVAHGVKVIKSFPAASSLTGWALTQDGQSSIVYTTPDGKTLLVGELIDENNQSLTQRYASEYLPKPDHNADFVQLERINAVIEGTLDHPKTVIYAFFDANCPFCHFTWQALQPYEKAGLQVHWIPVAVLGETSLPKALEIMSSSDKLAAFQAMQQHYRMGAPLPAGKNPQPNPKLAEQIRANADLMQKFGISGTPGIVWKDHSGKILVKSGMPRLSEIPAMTTLPEQKIDDPALQKFR